MEKIQGSEQNVRLAQRLLLRDVWSLALLILWSVWWGGLTFYAIVVVPVGTELIGSVEQGFITQQVTWWHNWLLAILVASLCLEAWCQRSRLLCAVAMLMLMINLTLFTDHAFLTSQMDFEGKSVTPQFYSQHAIYLWIVAAEWSIGIAIPFVLRWTSNNADPRREQCER